MQLAVPAVDSDAKSLYQSAADYLARRFPDGRVDRVLLVTPPDASEEIFNPEIARRGTYSNFPPYGLAVLAQHLREIDVEVEVVNLNDEVLKACHLAETPEQFDFSSSWQAALDAVIAEFEPHLIGVTCMFTMTHDSFRAVCARAANSGIPTIIGGVHVSNDVQRILDDIPAVDMAIIREGDVALPRLVEVVRGTVPSDMLGQLVIRDSGEVGRLSLPMPCMPDSEEIDVVPAFELIDVADLANSGVIGSFHYFKPLKSRFATVLSNRGCRGSCTFCSVRNFNGKGVRQRSVQLVLDELQELEEVYGINHIMWLDDDLLKDHRRTVDLFDGMVQRGLKMTWDASNGVIAASCTDEVIAAAAASGCIGIIIGMESGNPKILRDIRKPGTVDNFLGAAEVLRKYDTIYSSVFLMIGFPGETMSMIRDTINVSRDMALDWYRIKPLQPLPGTPIYEAMIEEGLIEGTETANTRYVTGAYARTSETGDDISSTNLEDVFRQVPDDEVPTAQEIDDIWFYMNYLLNYDQIVGENRPGKLAQHLLFVRAICDRISPENPFALYSSVEVGGRLENTFDEVRYNRLKARLGGSEFWSNRFSSLGLTLDGLNKNFGQLQRAV